MPLIVFLILKNNLNFSLTFKNFEFNNEEKDKNFLFVSILENMIQQEKKIEESKKQLI